MKTIGIIGGMGPEASADLFLKILDETQASCDQEHIPMLLDSNTRIPDRTKAILAGGADPVPEMVRSAKRLEAAGAGVLAMSCNTAHYFYNRIVSEISIPLLHMPRETAKAAAAGGYKTVALLATSGTVQSGVYADAFSREAPDVSLLTPDAEGQEALMSMIYDGVKAGKSTFDTTAVAAALDRLSARGAEAFILGCTELPLAFVRYALFGNVIDPSRVLARAAVVAAGAQLKRP